MKVAIGSGKGGTGKTTVSTNLSVLLSKEMKLVLVDLDVEEPNSGLFLQGELKNSQDMFTKIPKWNPDQCKLCGQCQSVCNFNAVLKMIDEIMVFPEMCHGCYACSELCPTNSLPMVDKKMGDLSHWTMGNLEFVEGKLIIGEEQAVPLIKQTIDYSVKIESELYLFDSPPGTSCPFIEATKDADFVILVTEPTPFGFHDLKIAIEAMEKIGKEIGIVINKYGIGNDDVIHYCEENNIPIIAKVPNSKNIAQLYSQGKLIYDLPEVKVELQKIVRFLKQKMGDKI